MAANIASSQKFCWVGNQTLTSEKSQLREKALSFLKQSIGVKDKCLTEGTKMNEAWWATEKENMHWKRLVVK